MTGTEHPLSHPEWSALYQRALNAVEIPTRSTKCPYPPGPIPVTIRVAWERDGEELIEARAVAWTRTAVLAHWTEPRIPTNGLWLPAQDVRRRE